VPNIVLTQSWRAFLQVGSDVKFLSVGDWVVPVKTPFGKNSACLLFLFLSEVHVLAGEVDALNAAHFF
jgi:hypothetical protein